MSFHTCSDTTEAIELDPTFGLYLKPISKLKINVLLPKLCLPTQSISSWQVMEKLKTMVKPDTFLVLKTLKITTNVIKFEGEFETKSACERALARLKTANSIKLSGFADKLQIRAALVTSNGPTRHDWEAFFRDAKGVNEMKPGERPDTVHLMEMPIRWFSESGKSTTASERILRNVFETFGKIRRIEILQSSSLSSSFTKTSTLHSELMFEVYIQYEEYVEFSIAMDSLRGKKLLYKEPSGKMYSADIKVDFDRNNYLSEKSIKKRESESKATTLETSKKEKKLNEDNKHKDLQKNKEYLDASSKTESKLIADRETIKKVEESSQYSENSEKEACLREAKLLLKDLLLRAQARICSNLPVHKTSEAPVQRNDKNSKAECQKMRVSTKHQQVKDDESDTHSTYQQTKVKSKSYEDGAQKHALKRKHSKERKETTKKYTSTDSRNIVKYSGKDDKYSKRKYSDHKQSSLKHKSGKTSERNSADKNIHEKRLKSEVTIDHRKRKKDAPAIEKREGKKLQALEEDKRNKERLILQERILKEKLIRNLRAKQEEKRKHQAELRKELSGSKVLKSVLARSNSSLNGKS